MFLETAACGIFKGQRAPEEHVNAARVLQVCGCILQREPEGHTKRVLCDGGLGLLQRPCPVADVANQDAAIPSRGEENVAVGEPAVERRGHVGRGKWRIVDGKSRPSAAALATVIELPPTSMS